MALPSPPSTVPRRWLVRGAVALLVVSLFAPAAISALTHETGDEDTLQRGTVERAANGSTVVSIQGFHFEGQGDEKKPARLVSTDERAHTEWLHNGSESGARWFYDVDPLPNGNLLVVSTEPGTTVVYEFDPDAQERVWTEEFDIEDTHDVDRLSEDELIVANMRNWDGEESGDRVFVYNRTTDEVTWEWTFSDHYPASTDGGHDDDWSHVNDVDVIDEHRILLSPRNFDQAIVVNRTTDEIELQLGEDGNHDVLAEQHNPDYLESDDGTPTLLVADSENDRVVEYALADDCETPEDREKVGDAVDCEWELVWEVGGEGQFNWPRDADRLPNGNTLITDTLNHRVVEVTPEGRIVWEYYATWGPYDAERVAHGDESNGPTMQDQGVSGSYDVHNSAGLTPGTGDRLTFESWLAGTFAGTPVYDQVQWFAQRWAHVTPWIRPVWMSGWDFVFALLGALTALGWGAGELVHQRRRVVDGTLDAVDGVRRTFR